MEQLRRRRIQRKRKGTRSQQWRTALEGDLSQMRNAFRPDSLWRVRGSCHRTRSERGARTSKGRGSTSTDIWFNWRSYRLDLLVNRFVWSNALALWCRKTIFKRKRQNDHWRVLDRHSYSIGILTRCWTAIWCECKTWSVETRLWKQNQHL